MIKFCMEKVTSSDTGHFWINWYDDVDSMFVGQLHNNFKREQCIGGNIRLDWRVSVIMDWFINVSMFLVTACVHGVTLTCSWNK